MGPLKISHVFDLDLAKKRSIGWNCSSSLESFWSLVIDLDVYSKPISDAFWFVMVLMVLQSECLILSDCVQTAVSEAEQSAGGTAGEVLIRGKLLADWFLHAGNRTTTQVSAFLTALSFSAACWTFFKTQVASRRRKIKHIFKKKSFFSLIFAELRLSSSRLLPPKIQ